MFQSDIAVLTGAGTSIPVGVPGMAEMAAKYEASLHEGSPEEKGYRLLIELGASKDIEELLQLASLLSEFPGGALGTLTKRILSPRGKSQTLEDFKARLTEAVEHVEKTRSTLLSWITRACLRFDRDEAQRIYGSLVAVMSERGAPCFSTNYDAVWDYVATSIGISVVDNFVCDEFERQFWDARLQSFVGDGLQLVKIHGSIHWHRDPSGRVEKLGQPAKLNQEGEKLERLLIFPTRFKDIYEPSYFPLYTAFTQSVSRSKCVLVIGHSLRDEYLLAAIRERLRHDDFTLVVVDPNFPAQNILNEAATAKNQIIHFRNGIEQLAPLLEKALAYSDLTDVVDSLREASVWLKSGREETITLHDLPRWVDPGERLEVEMEVDTVLSDGTLRAHLESKDYGPRTLSLTSEASELDVCSRVAARNSCRVPVEIELPTDLQAKKSYTFVLSLIGSDGSATPHVTRSLRVRKHRTTS